MKVDIEYFWGWGQGDIRGGFTVAEGLELQTLPRVGEAIVFPDPIADCICTRLPVGGERIRRFMVVDIDHHFGATEPRQTIYIRKP